MGLNREYLAPQIRSMNNRFHSEAKLPWSYDYPLANHIATNKSSANREMPLFSRLYPPFGYLRNISPPRGLKYSLLSCCLFMLYCKEKTFKRNRAIIPLTQTRLTVMVLMTHILYSVPVPPSNTSPKLPNEGCKWKCLQGFPRDSWSLCRGILTSCIS